ncbi:hypothetical protein SESBI_03524 [Sesbania bispinosa]|nr:hypothetical protein SESBI_03524 [Sesbania bispinosa]
MPIRIPNRLRQRKLWRVVGFISSVFGLICYALSSSFKHLFGEWNIFKIIVYMCHPLLFFHCSSFQNGFSTEIGTQGMEDHVAVEIDAADGGDSGADHNKSHFQRQQIESLRRRMVVKDEVDTNYNNGHRQIHHSLRSRMVDDGYNWKKYEENKCEKE